MKSHLSTHCPINRKGVSGASGADGKDVSASSATACTKLDLFHTQTAVTSWHLIYIEPSLLEIPTGKEPVALQITDPVPTVEVFQ